MNRSLIVLSTLVAALVTWFGFFYEGPSSQSRVVVISHPWHTASAVQSNQQAEQEKRASVVAQPASSAELPVQSKKSCEPSKAAEAFRDRRSKILMAFDKEINGPRKEQGLEPLDRPKVEPTSKEKAAIIREFQVRVQKFDPEDACLGPGNMDDRILHILSDIEDAGIKASDLGAESFQKLTRLGQKEADETVPNIQHFLDRGCYGTAGYIMDMYIHGIARGLGNTINMGYQNLDDEIKAQSTFYQGDDETLREVSRIEYRQRAKALGCGMG